MGFRQESENQLNLQSVILFIASVFCLRQTQEYTGEPNLVRKGVFTRKALIFDKNVGERQKNS